MSLNKLIKEKRTAIIRFIRFRKFESSIAVINKNTKGEAQLLELLKGKNRKKIRYSMSI